MLQSLEKQWKRQMVDGSDPISSLSFFPVLKMACNTNRIPESAAIWLFHFFMKKRAGEALNARTSLSSLSCAGQEGELTLYCEVVKHMLATYAIDDIIAKASMDIMNFRHGASQRAVQYAQALWTKALRCNASSSTTDTVSREYSFKGLASQSAKALEDIGLRTIQYRYRNLHGTSCLFLPIYSQAAPC